jgi:adenylosuccinate synthase
VEDTVMDLNHMLMLGKRVVIEGTQGYGLSLHTSGFYPFCTSRECTPHGLYAETGINPDNARLGYEEIIVVRTYPIRVGGNSGPLENEISWDRLSELTEGYVKTPEITTVTKKIRRIADIDLNLLKRAWLQTRPSSIALTFLDYLFPKAAGNDPLNNLPDTAEIVAVLDGLSHDLGGTPISVVSTGQDATYFVNQEKMNSWRRQE